VLPRDFDVNYSATVAILFLALKDYVLVRSNSVIQFGICILKVGLYSECDSDATDL
jgi:hypothetical protein